MWVGGLVGCPALEALRADSRADTMRDMRGDGYQRVEVLLYRQAQGLARQGIEIGREVLAGAVVRVSPGVDPALLTAVLRAVRGSGA